jgi:hypothetical protein
VDSSVSNSTLKRKRFLKSRINIRFSASLAWSSTLPNIHVSVTLHLCPPKSDILPIQFKCIDPLWLQHFMLQVLTIRKIRQGYESIRSMFAYGTWRRRTPCYLCFRCKLWRLYAMIIVKFLYVIAGSCDVIKWPCFLILHLKLCVLAFDLGTSTKKHKDHHL